MKAMRNAGITVLSVCSVLPLLNLLLEDDADGLDVDELGIGEEGKSEGEADMTEPACTTGVVVVVVESRVLLTLAYRTLRGFVPCTVIWKRMHTVDR